MAGQTSAGRYGIRKFFDIRSVASLLALAFVALIARPEAAGSGLPGPGLPIAESRLAVARHTRTFYPMGWFDELKAPSRLSGMRSAGMNIVMPYAGAEGSPQEYLDRAKRTGLKVWVEIDRTLLMAPNPVLVRRFVEKYRQHPSVYGWLLMDEPTLDDSYRAVTPGMAKTLYQQIKAADPKRPVGIVFGVTEEPEPYLDAMDVLMYDDYVQGAGTPEFWGLGRWRLRLRQHAAMAASLDGYIPILQSFGEDAKGKPQIHKRLPTSKEMRYITYTSIQYHATGIFFWSRYRSRKDWIDRVLTPLSKEIAPALRAMAGGPIAGASAFGDSIRSTLFRDPSSKAMYLLVVHHAGGTAKGQVNLHPGLNAVRATTKDGIHDVSDGWLVDEFGPYAARLYRIT